MSAEALKADETPLICLAEDGHVLANVRLLEEPK
jgi:hypothetical protein